MPSINNISTSNEQAEKGTTEETITLSGQPYTLFIESLNAEKTKETYRSALKDYIVFRKYLSLEALVTETPEIAQKSIINFLIYLRKEGYSWRTRVTRSAAVKHFYDMNDIVLNWKKINKYLGEKTNTVNDRPYTIKEIRKMIEKCDERKRVMILLLASAGMRVGALSELKLKHLEKTKYGIYQIRVYPESRHEYVAFCTPECAQAIDEYLEFRKRYGEQISPESPLIREQFDRNDQFQIVKGRHVEQSTIMTTIKQLLVDAGLRSAEPQIGKHMYKRKEVMQIHGLRKFFSTTLTLEGVDRFYIRMLRGHKTGLDYVYDKPTIQELLEGNDKVRGYAAAMDALTINDEHRLQRKIVELTKKQDDLQTHKEMTSTELDKVKSRMEERDAQIQQQIEQMNLAHQQQIEKQAHFFVKLMRVARQGQIEDDAYADILRELGKSEVTPDDIQTAMKVGAKKVYVPHTGKHVIDYGV